MIDYKYMLYKNKIYTQFIVKEWQISSIQQQ